MALLHSFEKSGNFLFRYRGQIPVILFIFSIPVIYFTNYNIPKYLILSLTILSILLSVFGFIIRAISIGTTPKGTSGRNTQNQVAEMLNVTGIYSTMRHPLYFGNYFMWIGIVLFTFNIYFVIIVSLLFWLYYERIMFAEERFLGKKFGDEYMEWSLTTPAFFPSFKNYKKSTTPFSFKSVLRREYSGFLAMIFCFAFIDHLRYFFVYKTIEWNRISTWVFAAALIITLIIRTIKHKSKFLNEEGRS